MNAENLILCFRYSIERLTAGVEPVVPLTVADFRDPLGPGYTVGFYGWPGLSGRRDDCRIRSLGFRRLEQRYSQVRRMMRRLSFEQLGPILDIFHGFGHVVIGEDCRSSRGETIMSYSEVSGRDPIFYRWHTYLENIVQEFRDTRYNK